MSLWLWTFWTYSFLGYLLERGYAIATHADRQARKCFLLLPMCPVYGLGALAVLALGGGAGWYFKIYRPKQQRAAETEEDYGDELETYDDTPPWDEEDEDEAEGDK